MTIRRRSLLTLTGLVLVTVALPVAGCTAVLGDFDIQNLEPSSEAGAPGTGTPGEASTGDGSAVGDGGLSTQTFKGDAAVVTRPCQQTTDCPVIVTEPAGCATVKCELGTCIYSAIDKDGDGHLASVCAAKDGKTNVVHGDDCSDNDPTIFPTGPCSQDRNGTPIVYPTGKPTGQCKQGVWDCASGSAVCVGAVGPAAQEDCALQNDADCDGVPNNGCDCITGDSQPCGNIKGLPAPCTSGRQNCVAGKWLDCFGNVEPTARNCSSSADNDCTNGPDDNEVACQCPGGVAQGTTTACTVSGVVGVCASGAHTCVASPDGSTGVFNSCTGPAPAAKQCNDTADHDCNGISDELDVGCGTPCLDPLGSGTVVPAAQKFSGTMYGCPGRRNWSARAAACNSVAVCAVSTWTSYIRTAGSKPPSRQYWVDDNLLYGGTDAIGACWGGVSAPNACSAGDPMRVCALGLNGTSTTDVDGNVCNWTGCTSSSTGGGPNDYIGGCSGNDTAGTLCCPPLVVKLPPPVEKLP